MATAVASRFAVLSLDDEDDFSNKKRSAAKKKEDPKTKQSAVASSTQQKATDSNKKKNKNKKKTDASNQQQQAQVNGPNNGKNKKNKSKKEPGLSSEQWEEWKKKDREFVSDSYEQDLHEAVLQSKLDFEHQRKAGVVGEGQPSGGKGARKKTKPQPMSLEQFNNPKKEEETEAVNNDLFSEEDQIFFEQVSLDARRAFDRELRQEQARLREPYVNAAVTIAQLQDMLEKRDSEIVGLRLEMERLQIELHDVRLRNSKLCTILAHGEMKDKVGVLLEVERLQLVREELSNEVQSLHAQLEQERSKVHALSAAADNKKKGKKKTASESGQ